MKIYVKNMACVSCKVVVTDALEELKIPFYKVELGEIDTHQDVSEEDKSVLNTKLRKAGLESNL
jgi:copper chaperone CopZ